jgi:hypothetical protein
VQARRVELDRGRLNLRDLSRIAEQDKQREHMIQVLNEGVDTETESDRPMMPQPDEVGANDSYIGHDTRLILN